MVSTVQVKVCLVAICMLVFSCKKDQDSTKPIIFLHSPFEVQSYQVPSDILVSGKIEDDHNVEFVRISLFNEAQISVVPTQAFKFSGKSVLFEAIIKLDDVNLLSGVYYVVITCSDGTNESRLFRKIEINEARKKLNGIFVVTSDGSTTNVDIIDSLGGRNEFYTYSGDFLGSSLSSLQQTFTIAGLNKGEAISLKIPDKSVLWREAQFNQQSASFTAFNLFGGTNYLSYFNGLTKGRDVFGHINVSFDAYPGCITKELIVAGDRIVAFQKEISGQKSRICVYSKGTGMFFNQMLFGHDIVSWCHKSEGEVVGFGNNGGNGSMHIYGIEPNVIKESITLKSELKTAINGLEGTYYYVTNSGIYKLTLQPRMETLFKAGNFSALAYDGLNKYLLAAEGGDLKVYEEGTGAKIASYLFYKPIVAIHPWYNKD